MSIREFVATIQNSLSSSSLDDYISEEYIYNIGVAKGQLLIKRETDSRKLFKITSLFQTLPCVEMISVSSSECGIALNCSTIQRSKKKLPKTYLSNFGSLIQVFNLNRDMDYKEISPVQFKNLSLQKYKPRNSKSFWIDNDYLYIPDSEVELVMVSMLSPNLSDLEEFEDLNSGSNCSSFLDAEFPVPNYMLDIIIEATVSHIFNSKRLTKDENPNLNLNEKSEVR